MTQKDMSADTTMSRRVRLRRVVILCHRFAVNLAYYRSGQKPKHLPLQHSSVSARFWRTVNGNFIDTCVLEWCKLFADRKGKHHWGKIVTDPATFEVGLRNYLGMDEAAFEREIEAMLHYRDKFVAHLDSEEIMNIPVLDSAKRAVWFYHAYLVQHEAQPGDLAGLLFELDEGYAQCEGEARVIYEHNA